MRVELRKDGSRFWARATKTNVLGAPTANLGTLYLETRERNNATGSWGSWTSRKTKKVTIGGGQQWTDENYTPPKSTSNYSVQVRAAFRSVPQAGQSEKQATGGYAN